MRPDRSFHRWIPLAAAIGLLACEGARPEPLAEACDEVAEAVGALPGVRATRGTDSFPAFTGPEMRHGCVVRAEGTTTPDQPVPVLVTTFPDSLGGGWERDDALVADGPATTVYGLWRGDVLCLVRVDWGREPETPGPREAGPDYVAEVGCELLPDRVVPRS